MCGASGQQTAIETQQANMLSELTADYKTQFAGFQQILAALSSPLEAIVAKGPDQEGFGTAEMNALETQATERTANDYANAARAVNEAGAAVGGGNELLPSGGQAQLREETANAGAKESADLKTGITEADFATGRQNFWNATSALGGVAGMENPVGFANAATGAGTAAASTATQIATEDNSWFAPVMGAVGGVLAGALSKGGALAPST